MTVRQITGIVVLLLGVILLTIGMNAAPLMDTHWSNIFTGHFTKATTWSMLAGLVSVVVGLLLLLVRLGRSSG